MTNQEMFEAYVMSIGKYKKRDPKYIFQLDENGDYDNQDIYDLHHAWQAAQQREGYKFVPVEPTKAMLRELSSNDMNGRMIYKALLGATPNVL